MAAARPPSRQSLQIDALKAAYREGTTTPTQVVNEIYDAIEARGASKGNIWIELGERKRALASARALESKSSAEQAKLPLYGIVFAAKDNFDVAGWNTTAACPAFQYQAKHSAHCVGKLLDAGAICIGKTNLDQFATGLNGTRSPYGACENSFDSKYISGGSSSGSAVACALGYCSFSLGTDTAGSGRIPAALNNLVGLKPTRGRISCRGLVPACRTLDCPSIFALTARDATTVLQVMEGFDPKDEYSRATPPSALKATWNRTQTFRFGVPSIDQLEFFGNTEGPRMFEEACAMLEKVGGVRVEVDYRLFKEAADLLYDGPWVAERLAIIQTFMQKNPDAVLETTKNITNNGIQSPPKQLS